MSTEHVRIVHERPSHVRAIMVEHSRSALRLEAEGLLKIQPELEAQRRGYTPEQASILKQAVAQAGLKIQEGLRQIPVEDQTGRRSLHFIGDDDGQMWLQFANPLRIGNFAQQSAFRAQPRWWQK
jgi:hypothetical protein